MSITDKMRNNADKWRRLYEDAVTWKEKLEVIITVLQTELGYEFEDFNIVDPPGALVIRGVVHVLWDNDKQEYLLSLSVNIEPLGAVSLVNALHLCGIYNIDFLQNFYVSKIDKTEDGAPMLYHGHEAVTKFQTETSDLQREVIIAELESEKESIPKIYKKSNETYH